MNDFSQLNLSSGGQVRGQVHEYFHTCAPPKSYERHLIGSAHPFPLKREPDSKSHARVPRAGCSATSLIGLQPRAAPSSTNNPNPALPSPVPENQSINQSSRALQLNQASLIHSRQSIAHTHAHTRTHGYSIFATGGSGAAQIPPRVHCRIQFPSQIKKEAVNKGEC